MDSPSPRSPSLQSQLAERRWARIRAISQTSQAGPPPVKRTRKDRELPPTTPSSRRPTWRWLGTGAAVLVLAVLAQAGFSWWNLPSPADLAAGENLFVHEWTPHDPLSAGGDGLGPVFNARSCVECHFQGGKGGAGDIKHNVAAFEVLPTMGQLTPTGGVIHASATNPEWQESTNSVQAVFPVVPKGVTITAICQQPLVEDYDPVVHHSVNTPTLFGAGVIDRLSASTIRAHHARRMVGAVQNELNLDFKQTPSGRLRVLADGRIGKFGWKAQFATLEEFVANACAVEVGLTTPTHKQHLPLKHCADENAKLDLSRRQFRQLVAYVSELPAPGQTLPGDSDGRIAVARGRELFSSIGCADCHTPTLGSAEGVYSDFCLHDVTDHTNNGYTATPQVPVPEDHPRASEWKTPPLWDVAETAPYMHDGSAPTLEAAVLAHGGQARHVRERYRELTDAHQQALLQFLQSLK